MDMRCRSNFSCVSDLPFVGSAPRADSKGETRVSWGGLTGFLVLGYFGMGGDAELDSSLLRWEWERLAADLTLRAVALTAGDESDGEPGPSCWMVWLRCARLF